MEHTPFKLEGRFEPAGDQQQADEKLVEGVNDGLAHRRCRSPGKRKKAFG